jgi:serine/threonine protein kinase
MTSPDTSPSGQPDPAALLALGLATQSADDAASSASPLTPSELAAEFPQLEIVELLGRGGMGAVYKARQRDLDRLVALKILRPGLDDDPGFAERFTHEARALAQLNHPGIVTLYEFGKTSAGRYFILMEFVDGVNLRQLLAAGRLSPREALAIVPPLCDALQYAHDRGLIHRDIKPENILVNRLGRIKIADFGIAKIATGKSEASSSVEITGTPAYMAPEQRDRPAEVDHRADLYALGVVFYQMLTGELPATNQLRLPSTHVQIDVRLDEIVLRALEKDPARRYCAANDFKTQIETITNTPIASISRTDLRKRSLRIVSSPWLKFMPVVLMLVILISIISRESASTNQPIASPQTGGSNPTTESKVPESNPAFKTLVPPTADPANTNQPPRLRALNWLDQVNSQTSQAWLPTGETVSKDEQLPQAGGESAPSQPNTRFLCLWFSHPLFDQQSHAALTFLDHTGAPLAPPLKALHWGNQTSPAAEGWIISTARLSPFDDVPPSLIARLDYSLGAWTYAQEFPVAAKTTHTTVLTDGTVVGSLGQNADGNAFIEISLNPKSANKSEQLDFVAYTLDGRRLNRTSIDSQGYEALMTKRFIFDVPLAQLRTFGLRTRPIGTTDWTIQLHTIPITTEAEKIAIVEQAKQWLSQIDGNDYASSWKTASPMFQKAITEQNWSAALLSVRSPLGEAKSRRLHSATFATQLPRVPDGHYLVIEFSTDFARKPNSVETITYGRDPDGTWRSIGYFIR